ncbi:MAG TPA: lysophospholipid acyltransferase family protein [Sphingomonadaceae bacterium]|nr:lysophospholipid acyltransferase family protein [Sphingomonadaceae bacterium]
MILPLRIAAMILWLLALLPLHGIWRLFRRPSPWPRAFLGGIARIAGARVAVRGEPLPAPVLYLANHQSWLDIMVLAGASGAAFVSKDDVSRWPLFGWLASLNNTVFIARSDRNGVRQQADALASALLGPQPVALFPEGTTTDGAALLPFNASLLGAVAPPPPGVRVQPVAIDYGEARADIAWFGEETAAANVMRVLRRRGRFDVTLRFLPMKRSPGDRKRIARDARSAIEEALYGGASQSDRPFGSTRPSL